ncbi:Cyclic AMP receptor-like protein [Chlamydia trachomatis]|nr:Cyclic AMP receptor-like protein [Chlamydia trachomatis]
MDIENILKSKFYFWEALTDTEKNTIVDNTFFNKYKKGDIVHGGKSACTGIIYIIKGKLRGYILSEDGRDISLNKLNQNDICIMSGSCIIDDLNQNFYIEALEDTELLLVDVDCIKKLSEKYSEVKIFLLEIAKDKYQNAFNLMQSMMFVPLEKRLLGKLLEERQNQNSNVISITHEDIAKDIGSVREVVSRNLNSLQDKKIIKLSRGKIEILDLEKIEDEIN